MWQTALIALISLWLIAVAFIFPSKATPSNIVFGILIFVVAVLQMILISRRNRNKKR